MAFTFGSLTINDKNEVAIEQPKTKYELYSSYFDRIKKLCIQAYKCNIITTTNYFVEKGIPQDFMDKCWKSHLCGGGKGQNIMWNWSQNLKYPNSTVDNFLAFVKKQEEDS